MAYSILKNVPVAFHIASSSIQYYYPFTDMLNAAVQSIPRYTTLTVQRHQIMFTNKIKRYAHANWYKYFYRLI